jgi:hypothetical protein
VFSDQFVDRAAGSVERVPKVQPDRGLEKEQVLMPDRLVEAVLYFQKLHEFLRDHLRGLCFPDVKRAARDSVHQKEREQRDSQ